MPIKYIEDKKLFKLDTKNSSYIFYVNSENYLIHAYYGELIPDYDVFSVSKRLTNASFTPLNEKLEKKDFSPDTAPLEYSTNGAGDCRITSFSVLNHNGNTVTDLRYVSHKIYSGKKKIPNLPSTYVNSDDEAETLEVLTTDKVTGVFVTLIYTVFKNHSVITRSVKVENKSNYPINIENVASVNLDFPTMNYDMITLCGRWYKERFEVRKPLSFGNQSIRSGRGSSGHFFNPFVAIAENDATEDFGSVYGFNLVYSSNHSAEIECNFDASSRLVMGINQNDFSWRLENGEEFYSPEVVMVYSSSGIGEMSRIFHRFYRNNLIRGKWKNKKRPLLLNSWEGAGFDFDDEKLVNFAKCAKSLGAEMLVMDDGWFGKRNDDTTSLGDWFVNESKLKGGLKNLVDRVNENGLSFGIWFEPEMISKKSELYKLHPDWCLKVPNREMSVARHQYVLDMSRKDVRDNIYFQMKKILSSCNIEYVKWDFNRNLTEVSSLLLDSNRGGEVFHRYILGVYEIMEKLTTDFPNILLENCSGGGGRFDAGMLYYSPQIWCSDDTDPIERLTIQFGTSMCYPASTMGAHVSANERTSINTRANVALWGSFGYELDPLKLTDSEKADIKEQVFEYHKYYDLIHNGDLYRLINPIYNKFFASWEFVSENKNEVLLTVVNMRRPENDSLFIKLKGLDKNKYYEDSDDKKVYSGALLMNVGINLTNTVNSTGSSLKKYYKAID